MTDKPIPRCADCGGPIVGHVYDQHLHDGPRCASCWVYKLLARKDRKQQPLPLESK